MKTTALLLLGSIFIPLCTEHLSATPVNGQLFYTTYAGGVNVKEVGFSYDGVSTFTLAAPTAIGATPGADGIVGNPQNSNLLIVGGQGTHVNTINKNNGTVATVASPVDVYHVAVADSTTLLGSSIPGFLARFEINPGGSLSPGVSIALSGNDSVVTSVIQTPSGFFYTSSGSGGFGSFGRIAFNNADVGLATAATTTRLMSGVASAHGAAYDPFTDDILLFGDSNIGQYDLGTAAFTQRAFAGMNFDQGAVDGQGHIFAASNTGHLLFLDYAASSSIHSGFTSLQFLDFNLDDVAPLIGFGGTSNVPDGGSSMVLLGLGVLSLAAIKRRNRG